ncbi:Beta-galactosidase BoGH2A [bacterium HR16]|nr:Beta-galactosidase BoGH2A [bacterium HR16]
MRSQDLLFIWWLSMAMIAACAQPVSTSTRDSLCLNGTWRFMPATGPAIIEPTGDQTAWGQIRVPGKWTGFRLPGLVQRGTGAQWNAFSDKTARGWYERTVSVPSSWQGRQIVLELQRVCTDAVVFVNGRRCGEVRWPGGEVDITDAVQAGHEAQLRLLVVATPDEQQVRDLLAGRQTSHDFQGWQWACGLTGEVFLHSRPRGARIADVFVQPSVRRRELAVDVELAGLEQTGADSVRFVARLVNAQGQTEREFQAVRMVRPAQAQRLRLVWQWEHPRLWDVTQPHLYTLFLRAQGAGIDDEYAVTFGFREFWIEGRRFMLNGKEIHLRPICLPDEWTDYNGCPEYINSVIDGYQRVGFNIGEQWPWDDRERGRINFRHLWAEIADRKGFLVIGALPSMSSFLFGSSGQLTWDQRKEEWTAIMLQEVKRLRNHPSIVLWVTTANLFGMPQDQNPKLIGRRGLRTDRVATAGREGIAIIKRNDPTRAAFTHQGADVGDLHSVNMYLNLIPLQEREEWLGEWVRRGDLPFMAIEFGTPFHATFLRGRNGFGDAIFTEPLATEFAAIYLGAGAYSTETAAYRDRIARTLVGGQRYSSWHGARELMELPAFQQLQALYIRNTWRSWRTWGISGGMVPWEMEPQCWRRDNAIAEQLVHIPPQEGRRGVYHDVLPRWAAFYLQAEGGWHPLPAGKAIIEGNMATMAWIAGATDNFTAKEHHFFNGQPVKKQAVLINDTRTEQSFHARWSISVGRKVLATGEQQGKLAPAAVRFVPITFTAPAVRTVTNGVIRLIARIGATRHEDTFTFRVYPTTRPSGLPAPVFVWDPEGNTTKLLGEMGVSVRVWKGTPDVRLLVIGRRALEKGPLPGSLKAVLANGGRVIILAQSPEWLRDSAGFRVAHHVSRRMFTVPSQKDHPVVQGLDNSDFRDWNGKGTLVPEFWGGVDEFPGSDPAFGWHWGNQGSVCSAAIEKPHRSGWTPVLEGEFDLAYTPLMELHYGKGLVVWCTLDVEARTKRDPAAMELMRRLLLYAAKATPRPRLPTFFMGSAESERLLHLVGVRYRRTGQVPPPPALLIVGRGASVDETRLRAFMQRGGRVLFLPREGEPLPFGFRTERRAFGGSLQVPSWSECRGLSPSDLRLRTDVLLPIFLRRGQGEVGASGLLGRVQIGNGSALFVAATPDMLNTGERTYLRYSAWRLTRTLAQLLANLGATFEIDDRSLDLTGDANTPVPAPSENELLVNNTFEKGLTGWTLEQHGGARAEAAVVNEVPSPLRKVGRAVKIVVTRPGTEGWHVQLNQRNLSVREGTLYEVTFWAKADRPHTLTLTLQQAGPSYNGVGLWETVRLTTAWRRVRFRFIATRTENNARLNFSGLGSQPVTIWLAEPSLRTSPQESIVEGFYHPDYMENQATGDDPYRYYRW